MSNKDNKLIWEAYDPRLDNPHHQREVAKLEREHPQLDDMRAKAKEQMGAPGKAAPAFKFTSQRPISPGMEAGDISVEIEDMSGNYYYVEADIEWYGSHYRARYSGTSAAEEPDEEPQIDGVNVVYVRDEDGNEVGETFFKSIDTWISDQIDTLGWSDMEAMGWDAPTDDGDY